MIPAPTLLDYKEKIAEGSGEGLKSLVVFKYGSKEPIYTFWRKKLRERVSSKEMKKLEFRTNLKTRLRMARGTDR